MRQRALVSGLIYVVAYTVLQLQTGAPLRVRVMDAVALAVGFLGPACLVSNRLELRAHWRAILVLTALGVLTWDALATFVIVKKEFLSGWYVLYPIGITFLTSLLFIQGYVLDKLARRDHVSRAA